MAGRRHKKGRATPPPTASPGRNAAPARPAPPHPPFRLASIGEAPWFAPALTAAYALVLAFALFHHELWRDEVQAWMLARDSTGPLHLFRNMEYEASPMLWHLLLLPLTRLTSSPIAMQVLHWSIASAVIFVVARHAPFDPLQKILFAFGYFPLYEYGVLSRNYALGLLLIVVMCALLRQRYRRPLWLALVLALMSHTSTHACIVAMGTMLVLALDHALNRRTLPAGTAMPAWKLPAAFALAAAGIALAVASMAPPADVTQSSGTATWHHAWYLNWKPAWLAHVLSLIPFATFFPVDPRFVPVLSLAPDQPQAVYGTATALALLAVALAFLWRSKMAVLLFFCLTLGLLAFFYAVHYGSLRHHGFLLVALLVSAWGGSFLGTAPSPSSNAPALHPTPPATWRGAAMARLGSLLLTGFLALHAFAGAKAVAIELERPFSHARQAATYIQASGLESLPLIGYPDWSASAVLGHLSPDKRIHYVQGNREGSFVIYDGERIGTGPKGVVTIATIVAQTRELAARNHGEALMILAGELGIPPGHRLIQPLAHFRGAMAKDEDFYLYLYRESENSE